MRAIVAEVPTALPPDRDADYPDTRKLGPLGWIYRYVLVSSDQRGRPPGPMDDHPACAAGRCDARAVPGIGLPSGPLSDPTDYHLSVRGDGTRAVVDGPGNGSAQSAQHDLEGLRAIMLDLLARASR